ncbi:MAG TPA: hypothetical protein VNK52_16180 [Hyphomicrobiaceae bacterium]|nr:hypothetical protein [Hyphomicrobiaceae bacterium]
MTLGEIKSLVETRLRERGFGPHAYRWIGGTRLAISVAGEIEMIDFRGRQAKAKFRVYEKLGMIEVWAARNNAGRSSSLARMARPNGPIRRDAEQADLEDAIEAASAAA